MNVELNPKLLDVVEFEDSDLGTGVRGRGTIVETLGEPPTAFLIEIADSEGVPVSYVKRNTEDLKTIWAAEAQAPELAVSEAQQSFEEGILYLQNGLVGQAKERFAKAFSFDAKLARSLLNATNALAKKGKFEAAICVYGLLLELQPQYELARQNLAAALVQRGIKQGRTGLLNQAIEDFNKALMLGPSEAFVELIRRNLVAAYTQLAIRYSDSRRYQEAISIFLWALELIPSETTQRNLAIGLAALSASKTRSESEVPGPEFFSRSVQMGLAYSECLNTYGVTLAQIGRISEARLALERALRADPRNEMAKRNLDSMLGQESPGNLTIGLLSLEPEEMHLSDRE